MSKPYLCARCRRQLEVSESENGTAILVKDHHCDIRNADYEQKLHTITQFIIDNEYVTTKDIAELTGEQVPNATRYLYDLMKRDIIKRDKEPIGTFGGSNPYIYSIIQLNIDPQRPEVSIS